MPADTTGSDGQALENPVTQVVTSPAANSQAEPQTPPTGSTPSQPASSMSVDEALAELKKVRAEAAAHRTKLAAFERAQAEAEAAKLSEQQRTEKRLADLQREHEELTKRSQERTIRYEVQLHATRMGIVDPDAAVKLLDWSELEYNDDGTPKNTEAVLKKLVAARPWLVQATPEPTPAAPQRNVQATNPGRSTQMPQQITAEQYLDRKYREDFRRTHGIDVMTAVTTKRLRLIN